MYRAYNGVLDESAYNYITNPFNTPAHKKLKWPAKMRNYNIIKPVIDLLLGEKMMRPDNYIVTVSNPDAVSGYQEAIKQESINNLQQMFINELNELGIDTGVKEAPVIDQNKLNAKMATSWTDQRAIMGQQAINYLYDFLEIPDKWRIAFLDFLVTGEVISYKEPYRDDIEYEIVSPIYVDYHQSPDNEFIEDGQWVLRYQHIPINRVIDKFRSELKPAQIDQLEKISGSGFGIPTTEFTASNYARKRGSRDTLIEVVHVVWRSFKKEGNVTKVTPTGVEEFTVSEGYTPEEDETVEWEWITEIRQGYRINDDIYVRLEAIPWDRSAVNNSSQQKLPYNGRAYSDRNAAPVSHVGLGMPYQMLYNIFHWKYELSIAKNKDSIILMDINAVPKKPGWDEDKFIYYADAHGFMWVDNSNPKARGFNQYQVLNSTLGDYIGKLSELMYAIKTEWEETMGINRQRKGQIMASDGKGNTDSAIHRSAVITADTFRKFEKFQQREMQGLLDLSKYAWAHGKKAMFISSDARRAVLDIEPDIYLEADLGVFAKNTQEEKEKIDTMKNLTFQFSQNKVGPRTIAEILDTDSFPQLKEKLAEIESMEAAMAQAESESAIKQAELQAQLQDYSKEKDRVHESTENQLQRMHEYNMKMLEAQLSGVDTAGIENNAVTREKNMLDAANKAQETALKQEANQIKREEIAAKERMNADNNRTALQNKVAGEK